MNRAADFFIHSEEMHAKTEVSSFLGLPLFITE